MHTHMQPTQKKIKKKSCLIQIVMGFSWDLQPHFRYCTLFQVMSFVWSSVESERRGLFLTQWIHKNKQKPNCWPWCWSFILGDSDCKFLVPRGHPNKLSFILGEMNWKTWHLHDSIFVLPLNDILFWKKRKTHTQKHCWIYKNNVFANWEKYKKLKLFSIFSIMVFEVVYQDQDTVTALPVGFHRERAAAGRCQVGYGCTALTVTCFFPSVALHFSGKHTLVRQA